MERKQQGAIYAIGNLNIELFANSQNIVSNDFYATQEGQWACGIFVTENLTISGTGVLQVTGGTGYTSHGISVRGELTIQNGNITAMGLEAQGVSAIYAYSGITINGGTVAAIANNATAGYSRGFECFGNIRINGGNVVAKAGEVNTNFTTYKSYGIDTSSIFITGGMVIASGYDKAIYGNTSGIVKGNNTIMVGNSASDSEEWDGITSLTTYKYFSFTPSTNNN